MRPLILIFLVALFVVTANGSCLPGQLSCDDGKECISSSSWCDQKDDCTDKSDENYCKKGNWWKPDPNNCDSTHLLCNNGRCVPKSAECNGHSDCPDGSDEVNCEKSSSEESQSSSEEFKTSSEKSKTSSEESITSSEKSKTSSEEDKISSEETETSSEESKSDKKDVAGPLTLDNNNYDEETPNLSTTKSTPSSTTVDARFHKQEIPMTPVIKGYYDRKLNGLTTRTPKNYIHSDLSSHSTSAPTFSNQGQYYPPPPPTYPRNTLTYQSYRPETQPTPNINRQPINPPSRSRIPPYDPGSRRQPTVQDPGSHRQTTFNAPEIHGQPERYPQNVHRQSTVQDPDSQRQTTFNSPEIRGQPSRYPPNVHRQPTNYNSDPNRQSTYNPSDPRRQSPNYPSDPSSTHYPSDPSSTHYPSDPSRQSTHYPSDPSWQSPYYTPNGRTQQPTYHHPTPRPDPYNNFHENVIPLSNGLSHHLSRHVPRYTGHRKILPRFNFSRDFSSARNDESVFRGIEWILSRREPYKGWGVDTPRAIVALSLANNSFENDAMKNYLNLQVGLKLLNAKDLRETELAHLVLALLATCQDPSDFQGVDLGRTLLEKRRTQHPFTLLTACLAGQPFERRLDSLIYDMRATPDSEKKKDRLILSLTAISCYLRSNPSEQTRLAQTLHNATSKLLELQLDDGSFGSVYSTAIAAQALMSLNNTLGWNPDSTFSFLRERQDVNGSFGDFLATYYVIPALRGRSLLHLRNTRCTPKNKELTPQEILEYPGEKQYLKYYLNFGYPLTNAYSVQMHVPLGINFFDVMRVAEYLNKHFNFQYDERGGKINVYSISDVPNDIERGLAWHLYRKRDSNSNFFRINEDLRTFIPNPNEHYIFWYHRHGLNSQLQ